MATHIMNKVAITYQKLSSVTSSYWRACGEPCRVRLLTAKPCKILRAHGCAEATEAIDQESWTMQKHLGMPLSGVKAGLRANFLMST